MWDGNLGTYSTVQYSTVWDGNLGTNSNHAAHWPIGSTCSRWSCRLWLKHFPPYCRIVHLYCIELKNLKTLRNLHQPGRPWLVASLATFSLVFIHTHTQHSLLVTLGLHSIITIFSVSVIYSINLFLSLHFSHWS